jgi:mono/diheme cytochrome c family protein
MLGSRFTYPALAGGVFAVALAASVSAERQGAPPRQGRQVEPLVATGGPDPREATTRRICGLCHPFETVVAIRRPRAQWQATVENMVGRGARGTPEELSSIVDFLSDKYALGNGAPPRGGAGPDDKPLVDSKAVDVAEPLWSSDCATCHGKDARGTARGPNLVRSMVVLSDRYGSKIGPYLRTEHPKLPSGKSIEVTDTQVLLFAHLLRSRLNDTLRGAPMFKPGNILVGDSKAGAAYFSGEGGCAKCHSASSDLAGIASRITDPVNLQQRFLFPAIGAGLRGGGGRAAPVVRVTVTPPSGPAVTGALVHLDDFYVTLRGEDGQPRTFRRAPDVRVVKEDPFAAHIALLDQITDAQIHDVVAYLWTLK